MSATSIQAVAYDPASMQLAIAYGTLYRLVNATAPKAIFFGRIIDSATFLNFITFHRATTVDSRNSSAPYLYTLRQLENKANGTLMVSRNPKLQEALKRM